MRTVVAHISQVRHIGNDLHRIISIAVVTVEDRSPAGRDSYGGNAVTPPPISGGKHGLLPTRLLTRLSPALEHRETGE